MRVKLRGSVVCGCAMAASILCGSSVRADLLVIPADNGSTSPVVFRFHDQTGALLSEFGHESEGYEGMTLGPDEKIYVTSNTLGYGDIDHFNRQGQYVGS